VETGLKCKTSLHHNHIDIVQAVLLLSDQQGITGSDVVNNLRFKDYDKDLGLKDKDLWSKDKDLKSEDKDFPQGQQHRVTVKNGLFTDIYQ